MSVLMSIVPSLLILISTRMIHATDIHGKIDFQLNIAVVVDFSNRTARNDVLKMEQFIRRLPDHFQLGKGKIGIAVIPIHESSTLRAKLIAEEESIRNWTLPEAASSPASTKIVLREVWSKAFAKEPKEATWNVALILTVNMSIVNEVKELEDEKSVWIIYAGRQKKVSRLAKRLYSADDLAEFKSDFKEWAKHEFECRFETVCRFQSREECVESWWQPRAPNVVGECRNSKPQSGHDGCPKDACHDVCDRLWPWDEPRRCDGYKTEKVDIRRGKMVESLRWLVEHCPRAKSVLCRTSTTQQNQTQISSTTRSKMPQPPFGDKGHGSDVSAPENSTSTSGLAPWAAVLIGMLVVVIVSIMVVVTVVLMQNRSKNKKGVSEKSRIEMKPAVKTQLSAGKRQICLSPAPSPGASPLKSPDESFGDSETWSDKRVGMAEIAAVLKAVEGTRVTLKTRREADVIQ